MATTCKRNASCRCADCQSAMGMISAKDLIQVASSKVFEGDENNLPQQQQQQPLPKPLVEAKITPKPPVEPHNNNNSNIRKIDLFAKNENAPEKTHPNKATEPTPSTTVNRVSLGESVNNDSNTSGGSLSSGSSGANIELRNRRRTGPRSSKIHLDLPDTITKEEAAAAPPSIPSSLVQPIATMSKANNTTERKELKEAKQILAAFPVNEEEDSSIVVVVDKKPKQQENVAPVVSMPSVIPATTDKPTPEEEDGSSAQVDYSTIPLKERVLSSDWKARKHGYDEIVLNAPNRLDGEYSSLISKCLDNESHAAALDSCLDCAIAIVRYGAADSAKEVESSRAMHYVNALVKRAFGGRSSTKQKACDLILELFAVDSPDVIAQALVGQLSQNKNMKVLVILLTCLRDCLNQFGRIVPPTFIMQATVLALNSTPPAVRSEGTLLALDACGWYGEAIKTIILSKIASEASKRELERKIIEIAANNNNNGGERKATRFRRGEEERKVQEGAKATVASGGGEGSTGNNAGMDLYQMLSTNEIVSKLPGLNYEKKILESETKKWTERKQALSDIEQLCGNPPKLDAKSDYSLLVSNVKRVILNDSNQAVVIAAISLIKTLSEGLRGSFSHLAKNVILPALLEKYREKPLPLIAATDACMDSISTWSFSVLDEKIISIIQENLSLPKSTPLQLKHTMLYLERTLSNKTLMQKNGTGSRALLLSFVKSKSTHPEPTIRALVGKVVDLLASSIAPREEEKKKQPVASTKPLVQEEVKSGGGGNDFVLDCMNELAAANLEFKTAWDLFENATKWQDRVIVFETLHRHIEFMVLTNESKKTDEKKLEAYVTFVEEKTKGFEDANPNIMSAAWLCVFSAAKFLSPHSNVFRTVVSAGLNKFADRKTSEIMKKILFEFCDGACGPFNVCRFICEESFKNVSLKSKPMVVEWLAASVAKYGALVCSHNNPNLFLKICQMDVGMVELKCAFVKLLGEIHSQLGPKAFVGFESSLLNNNMVKSEFLNRPYVGNNKSNGGKPIPPTVAPPSSTIPTKVKPIIAASKQDISAFLESKIVGLNSSIWKKREESLNHIEEHLTEMKGQKIHLSTPVKDLAVTLTKLFNDVQRSLAVKSVTIIGLLFSLCFSPDDCILLIKLVAKDLFFCLSEVKKSLHACVFQTLSHMVRMNGVICIPTMSMSLSLCIEPLRNKRELIGCKLLNWCSECLVALRKDVGVTDDRAALKFSLLSLLAEVPVCLISKDLTIRKAAYDLALLIGEQLPIEMFIAKVKVLPKELKPAEIRIVTPIIEEICVKASSVDVAVAANEETKKKQEGLLLVDVRKEIPEKKNEMQIKLSELRMQPLPVTDGGVDSPTIAGDESLLMDDDLDEFISPEKTVLMNDQEQEEEEEEEEKGFVAANNRKTLSASKKKLNDTFSYHSPTYDDWNPFQPACVMRLKTELNAILNPYGNNNELVEKMFSNGSLSSLFQELNSEESVRNNYKYTGPLLRWISCKLTQENPSPALISTCVLHAQRLLDFVLEMNFKLRKGDLLSFLPFLLTCLREPQKLIRTQVKRLIALLVKVFNALDVFVCVSKFIAQVADGSFDAPGVGNFSSSVLEECFEQLERILESSGTSMLHQLNEEAWFAMAVTSQVNYSIKNVHGVNENHSDVPAWKCVNLVWKLAMMEFNQNEREVFHFISKIFPNVSKKLLIKKFATNLDPTFVEQVNKQQELEEESKNNHKNNVAAVQTPPTPSVKPTMAATPNFKFRKNLHAIISDLERYRENHLNQYFPSSSSSPPKENILSIRVERDLELLFDLECPPVGFSGDSFEWERFIEENLSVDKLVSGLCKVLVQISDVGGWSDKKICKMGFVVLGSLSSSVSLRRLLTQITVEECVRACGLFMFVRLDKEIGVVEVEKRVEAIEALVRRVLFTNLQSTKFWLVAYLRVLREYFPYLVNSNRKKEALDVLVDFLERARERKNAENDEEEEEAVLFLKQHLKEVMFDEIEPILFRFDLLDGPNRKETSVVVRNSEKETIEQIIALHLEGNITSCRELITTYARSVKSSDPIKAYFESEANKATVSSVSNLFQKYLLERVEELVADFANEQNNLEQSFTSPTTKLRMRLNQYSSSNKV